MSKELDEFVVLKNNEFFKHVSSVLLLNKTLLLKNNSNIVGIIRDVEKYHRLPDEKSGFTTKNGDYYTIDSKAFNVRNLRKQLKLSK